MTQTPRAWLIGIALAASALSALSAQTVGRGATIRLAQAQTPFVIARGESRSDGTGDVRVKVSGADTGGAVAVLEVSTAMDAGAPLHMHHVENEWFYVLEGEYDIKVGERIYNVKPGASVYAPKLIPHTWHDVGEVPGKMLVVAQPAGRIEQFAKDLFTLTGKGDATPEAMTALFEKNGMEMLGPPLPKKRSK